MASNHEVLKHQPEPSNKSTFGCIANRIGTSASGLISSSLLRPDPLSVRSSLSSIGGDGSKARISTTSSSDSTSSPSIAAGGLARDDTWPPGPIPQIQEQATQAGHLQQWRHQPYQTTITSEFEDFVSDSARLQAQPRATTQIDQTGGEYRFHAGSTPGFAAIQMGQFQAGVLADESCQATEASPSQVSTEWFSSPIRDSAGPEDFTSDWKRLHVQHFGDIQTAQYRHKPGHRTTTDGSSSALRSPKDLVHPPVVIKSPSDIPEDGAEVVSLLSDPEFFPAGEFNDQLQSSIDDLLLEDGWLSGAMASASSQSRETSQLDSFFGYHKSKAAPSVAALAGSPSDEKIAVNRGYRCFPARYVEEVWGYFSGTAPPVAVKKYPKWDEANDKGRTTALSRLVMVFNHLGPNPTEFASQN